MVVVWITAIVRVVIYSEFCRITVIYMHILELTKFILDKNPQYFLTQYCMCPVVDRG